MRQTGPGSSPGGRLGGGGERERPSCCCSALGSLSAGGTQWQMFPHNCLDTTGGCGGHWLGLAWSLPLSSLHTSGESSQPTINCLVTQHTDNTLTQSVAKILCFNNSDQLKLEVGTYNSISYVFSLNNYNYIPPRKRERGGKL